MRTFVHTVLLVASLFSAGLKAQEILVLGVDGDPAPDGNGVLGPVSIFALTEGAAAFANVTTGSSNGSANDAILVAASWRGLDLIFREGDPAPGNGTFNTTLGQIDVNSFGEVAFYGILDHTSHGSANNQGIYRGSADAIDEIVRRGDPAGGSGVFNSFGVPTINFWGHVAFWGAIDGAGTPLISTHGIFAGDGENLVQIARTYTPAPDGNGEFSSISSSASISNTVQVAFRADLRNTLSGDDDNSGLFRGNGLNLVTIARENDLAPDGNGRLSDINFPWLNETQIARSTRCFAAPRVALLTTVPSSPERVEP